MKKRHSDTRGFSLVELIIVVAIMAVLVGLLAPQYLRYLEKTKIQRVITDASHVADAITVGLTDITASDDSTDFTTLYQAAMTHNPVDLSDPDGDGKFILSLIDDSISIDAQLYLYWDNTTDSFYFTYEMLHGKYGVDYKQTRAGVAYVKHNGDFHVYRL